MRPTIRQLEYAVAVADHLSFRRAARSCHVSQPALSAQIRDLETNLGLELFERDRRRVLVTPVGERLVARARAVLREADGFVEAANSHKQPLVGDLRIGVIPTVAPYVLPAVLRAANETYPELRVLLREEQTHALVDRLQRGELDMLLLALEADLGEAETLPLYSDPFVVAMPSGHRLASRRSVNEADLEDETLLLLEDGHCLREQALAVCRFGKARELGDFRASSLNTLVRMVEGGLGITLLPGMAVSSEVHGDGNLVVRPVVKRAPSRTIGLAWRPSTARRAEYRLLAKVFDAHPPAGVKQVRRAS